MRSCRMHVANAVLAAGSIVSMVVQSCGDDKGTGPGDALSNTITFVREDSSVIQFSESAVTYAWCGDWEPGNVPVPALHVLVGSYGPGEPYWWLRAVVSDIEIDVPLSFPNYFVWDQPDSVNLFLYDPPNELSTDTEESDGTITFHQLPCPRDGTVDFSIDAVLGSEYGDMPTVVVRGRFRGHVTTSIPYLTLGWKKDGKDSIEGRD
jgi:hypothetical protein